MLLRGKRRTVNRYRSNVESYQVYLLQDDRCKTTVADNSYGTTGRCRQRGCIASSWASNPAAGAHTVLVDDSEGSTRSS
ncbi:hypothetical protein RB195_006356 [Necator americanus]|uniref:Uncharacterized protein n=1 Tax=Necator americanus TaxID=51031 RepID=A0ABR1BW20_NECAM